MKDPTVLSNQLKAMMKEARVPFYACITTVIAISLVFGFSSWVYYKEHQGAQMAASYAQQPIDNVFAIVKVEGEDEAYPYEILYISHIQEGEAVVFPWKFAYTSYRNALKDFTRVKNSISANNVKKDFHEPIIVSVEAFHDLSFVTVIPFSIAAVDLEQFHARNEVE